MNSISLAFAVSLTTLTAVSLATKGHLLPSHKHAGDTQQAEMRAAERLLEDGWLLVGSMPLTVDSLASARVFVSPRCEGAVLVVGLPPTGEAATLIDRLAGPDGFVLYLDQGRLTPVAPGAGAYILAKLAPLIDRLGGSSTATPTDPPIAVVTVGACADSTLLPWTLTLPPTPPSGVVDRDLGPPLLQPTTD